MTAEERAELEAIRDWNAFQDAADAEERLNWPIHRGQLDFFPPTTAARPVETVRTTVL